MTDFIDTRSVTFEDNTIKLSDADFIIAGRKYRFVADKPMFVTGRNEYGKFEFVTDGSKTYFVPSSCNLRKKCKQNLLVHLPYSLKTKIGVYDDIQIIEEWANSLDLSEEEIRNQILLYDKTENRVLKYADEWLLHLSGTDPHGGGKSDYIELFNLEPRHELVLIWGLLPWAEEGQGSQSIVFRYPHDDKVSTLYLWGFSGERGHIDVRPSDALPYRVDPSYIFSDWVVETYPTFIDAITSWMYYRESGDAYLLRNFDDIFDVDSAPDNIISTIADTNVPFLPVDQVFIKKSHDIWSSKGTYDFAKAIIKVLGGDVIDIWYPKEKILRLRNREFVTKKYIYLVQLDRLDVNGHDKFIVRQPYDPPKFSSYGTDKLDTIIDTMRMVGLDSGVSALLKFDSWLDNGNGTRIAKMEVVDSNGEFSPWERIRPEEASGITEANIGYPHVVPVVSRGIKIVSSGSGHMVGEIIDMPGSAFKGKAIISQVVEGKAIKASITKPFIYITDNTMVIKKAGTGEPAVLRPVISTSIVEETDTFVDEHYKFGEMVLEGYDLYHPFSYVVKSNTPASIWIDKFRRIAHPAGHKLVVDYAVTGSQNGCVNISGDIVSTSIGCDQIIRRNQCRYEDSYYLDNKYWPKKPLVITDGKIEKDPDVIYGVDEGKDVLYTNGRSETILVCKPTKSKIRGGWFSHAKVNGKNYSLSDLFISRKSEAFALSSGSMSVSRIDSPNHADDGSLVIYGDHKSLVPTNVLEWQKQSSTKIDNVNIDPVEWSSPAVNGVVSYDSGISFAGGELFEIRVLYNKPTSQSKLVLKAIDEDGGWASFGIDTSNDSIILSGTSNFVKVYVYSFDVRKIPQSTLREVKLVCQAATDFTMYPSIISDGIIIPYVYIGNIVGNGVYPSYNGEQDFIKDIIVGKNNSVYMRSLVVPIGIDDVTTSQDVKVFEFYHPMYDFYVSYTKTSVDVWFNGAQVGSVSIDLQNGHLIEYGSTIDNRSIVIIDGNKIFEGTGIFVPEKVIIGKDIKIYDFTVVQSDHADPIVASTNMR